VGLGLHAGYALRRPRVPHAHVLDQGNREALAIEISFSLPSRRVLALLEELVALHGAPRALRMDNGPEFLASTVVAWAEARGITLDFIQPGQPAQNAFIERFNQTYRAEILDAHLFSSLTDVRALTADWLPRYNTERPHDSLGRVPHHAITINIRGNSYRLKEKLKAGLVRAEEAPAS
jgi:putative transposase